MNIIDKLGIDAIKPYIPFGMNVLIHYYLDGDKNFDKTNIRVWENASGYYTTLHVDKRIFDCNIDNYGLEYLLRHNGIKNTTLSQRVDILKEAARILCEREINKQ
jgi:hypothetical protein